MARRIASGITTFVIAFVLRATFCCRRKIKYSDPESDVCIHERRSGEKGSGCLFSELPYIFEFPDRTMSGGRDSGNDVCVCMGILTDAICDAHWCSDRVYCADSDFRGIYWLRSGSISDPDGGADEGFGFVIMFLILQQIEGNLIYPRVVGSSVGLPSIWVLAAVSIGASLMGIVGMLVFIPIVSVLYALLRGDVYEHLEKRELLLTGNR